MEQRVRVARIDRCDAAEAGLGLFAPLVLVQDQAKVVERRQVIRFDFQRTAIVPDRRFPLARRLLGVAQILQGFRAARQGT
jgi:hypothetical protein